METETAEEKIRENHVPDPKNPEYCWDCDRTWPCPSVVALNDKDEQITALCKALDEAIGVLGRDDMPFEAILHAKSFGRAVLNQVLSKRLKK